MEVKGGEKGREEGRVAFKGVRRVDRKGWG